MQVLLLDVLFERKVSVHVVEGVVKGFAFEGEFGHDLKHPIDEDGPHDGRDVFLGPLEVEGVWLVLLFTLDEELEGVAVEDLVLI